MNIEIHLNEGKIIETFYADYNADTLATVINNSQSQMIAFGDTIIAKHSIKLIKPVETATV